MKLTSVWVSETDIASTTKDHSNGNTHCGSAIIINKKIQLTKKQYKTKTLNISV